MNQMIASAPATRKEYPVAKAGNQPARVIHVVDLGVQKREWNGEVKEPARQLFLNFELVNDEFEMDGEKMRHRISPRPYNVFNDQKAALTKLLKVIDPQGELQGDLSKLANMAVFIQVIHNKKIKDGKEIVYANCGQISLPIEGYPVKELSQKAVVFSFDNPTVEDFKALPRFLQEKLKQAVNYPGSKVEAVVKQFEAEQGQAAKSIPAQY
jgi:hypothetical protein